MKLLSFALLIFSFSGIGHAANKGGLFVEPTLTYERGDGDTDLPAPFSSSDTEVNGFGVGARLGFHLFESLFIGADGRYSMPKFEDAATDQDVDSTSWNYGPVAGIQMPTLLGLRIWASYVLGGNLDPEKDQGLDLKFKDASGYRIGAGIKLGVTSLNIEYQDITYDETEITEAGIFTPGYSTSDVELSLPSWVFSVSFPISI